MPAPLDPPPPPPVRAGPGDQRGVGEGRQRSGPTRPVPTPRRPSAPPRPKQTGAPLPVAALVTTVWAIVVSAGPVLLATAGVLLASPTPTDASAVLRGGLAAWLLAHSVPLATPIG